MATYTSVEDEEFFGAIGRLAVSWAHLEFALDCVVEFLYHTYDGRKIEAEIPRALKRKINFLRTMFKSLPIGERAISGYLILLARIEAASEGRHDIIHGVVIEHVERSGEAKLIRPIRSRRGITKRHVTATTKSILEAAHEAQGLGTTVFHIVSEFLDLLDLLKDQHAEQQQT